MSSALFNYLSNIHAYTGTCIGEPFSSPKRFPVIPPFGLPELAGQTLPEPTVVEIY